MLNPLVLNSFIDQSWQKSILPSLSAYIKIANKSPHFDKAWQEHGLMDQAATHIASWCLEHGPKNMILDILRHPDRTPLLVMDIPGSIDGTILLYGHLDKQPEMSGWEPGLSPWTPVLRGERLYGRGAADDGYAAYSALTAIMSLQAQNLPHPRCLILIEASEESGSPDLPFYINELKDKLGKPELIICLDSGAGNYEQLWLTTSLRGHLSAVLKVELLTEGIHSGLGSGIVADSFRVARALLSRIEDETTGDIKLAELHTEIPPLCLEQAKATAEVLGAKFVSEFPWQPGTQAIDTSISALILNRSWRPSLCITGAEGLPALENAGNVLRPKTSLKLSLRLPPLLSPKTAVHALVKELTEKVPYQAKVSLEVQDQAQGWYARDPAPWLLNAVEEASLLFYQKSAMYTGEGGSIPFMAMLGEEFPQAQFMITGVLGPGSNAHGPNEFLHLDMAKKVTACVAYVIYQQGLQDSNKFTKSLDK